MTLEFLFKPCFIFRSYNSVLLYLQNYVQTISNLLKEEHHDKWEEAQLVRDKRVCVFPPFRTLSGGK